MNRWNYDDIDDVKTDWWKLSLVVMVMLMAIGLFVGCKSTRYVTVPEYHKEYIVHSDTIAKVDSVVMKDSIFVYHNGDTVIVNKVLYRDMVRNVYKVRIDSFLKTDSIPYPVEKELTKTETEDLALGSAIRKMKWWILLIVVIAIGYEVARWWRKKNK